MPRTLVQILLNALALVVVAHLVPGISYSGGLLSLLVAGLVLGLINLIVRPLVILLSLPMIVLTLGLFFLAINGILLYLAAALLPALTVSGCMPALLGGLVLGLFNWVVRTYGVVEKASGKKGERR